MKINLTYLLIGALVFCACSSGTEDPESGAEIRVSPTVASRSGLTTTSNIAARGSFALYGDKVFKGSNADGNLVKVFENREIKYKDNAWQYDNTEYWFPNHEHSFVAIHPFDATTAHSYDNSQLQFTFTLPQDYTATPDLLVATHRRFHTGGSAQPVVFMFNHVLSLINFAPAYDDNVMSTDAYIEFHKLELSGFKTQATFSVLPESRQSANQTDDMKLEISNQSVNGNYTFDFEPAIRIANQSGNINLFPAGDALIMIPQTFASDSGAKIILYYTVNGSDEMKQAALSLNNQKWVTGKSYTYKFTVSMNGAHFDAPTIADWDELSADNINAQ